MAKEVGRLPKPHCGFQLGLVLVTAALLAASFVGSRYLRDQPLHHLPTALALPLLWRAARKGWLSDVSFIAVILFIWVHILGARYVYSFVPYDEWSRSLFSRSISNAFGFKRNHYDRFAHLAYGLLATFPQVELLRRRLRRDRLVALGISLTLVLAVGALYELFEWSLAMIVAPDWADRYNGQQGDLWDAQKDMALALLGAFLASIVLGMMPGSSHDEAHPSPHRTARRRQDDACSPRRG